jgi:hypothetical protein
MSDYKKEKRSMTTFKVLCLSIVFMCIAGCCPLNTKSSFSSIPLSRPASSQAAQERRSAMIGKWFGLAALDDGRLRAYIIEHHADGTFKIHFRTYTRDNKYEDQIEIGVWGVSGNIHFTITQGWLVDSTVSPVDPADASFYDAYEIIKLTKDELEYKAVYADVVFAVRRVPASFELPEDL